MAPARPRAVDDSRSEASSTIASLKEKAALNAPTGAGISKNKRNAAANSNGVSRLQVNGTAGENSTAAGNLPKIDWSSMSPLTLISYRTAYQIPTASCYFHPHADIIYHSSQTALRAPSAVLARSRMHEFRQKQRGHGSSKYNTSAGKKKSKSSATNTTSTSTMNHDLDDSATSHLKVPMPPTKNGFSLTATTEQRSTSPTPSHASLIQHQPPQTSTTVHSLAPPDQTTRQTPASLSQILRKHFNAQQLSELDTVAKFLYVVRDNATRAGVRTEGSAGDGMGSSMGSQGRAIRRGEGGEVGFRLRFKPR